MGLEQGDIQSFIRVADVASELRRLREKASEQLDLDKTKEEIRKKILRTAEITGEQLTPEEVDVAINSYFTGLYSFPEPEKNLNYRLASMYVDRAKIAKWYGGGTLAIATIAGAIWLSVTGVKNAYLNHLEKKVETAIEKKYKQKQNLLGDIAGITTSAASEEPAQRSELEEIAELTRGQLKTTDGFFEKYCSDGTADDDITRENYEEAEKALEPIEKTLFAVNDKVVIAEQIINLTQTIKVTQQTLDTLIAEIRNNTPPELLLTRAEAAYSTGTTALKNRQLQTGQESISQLRTIKTQAEYFTVLPTQLEQAYSSIQAIVKEAEAKEQADTLYSEGKSYISSVDIPQLRASVEQLQGLDAVLKQEYSITIVNRKGVKSGIDRYFTDEHGKRSSGYYVILEATDSSGNIIPQQIKSEENNSVQTVSMWGERVPAEIFERVKQDKIDNGIINDNIFAKKERGYRSMKVTMLGTDGRPLERKGQITRW